MAAKIIAAVVGALAALVAGPAAAAIMQATIYGNFNDHPLWRDWTAVFVYDTEFGTTTLTGSEGRLAWSDTDGTASPLISMTETVTPGGSQLAVDLGWDIPSHDFVARYTSFTSFEVLYDRYNYSFKMTGPVSRQLGFEGEYNGPFGGPNFALDQPYAKSSLTGSYNWLSVIGPDAGTPITLRVSVVQLASLPPSPTPEPTSWAMLITGFGLTGGLMRLRPRAARQV